ncbi:hypothetical protein WJX72_001664 [[Myrmecia] bisecta]|uniref:Rieske domain-containing protein n=1 Tax=[Myrmecia] bisecta TaxID=41462 RepID=A0AAW1R5L5_9CHLO
MACGILNRLVANICFFWRVVVNPKPNPWQRSRAKSRLKSRLADQQVAGPGQLRAQLQTLQQTSSNGQTPEHAARPSEEAQSSSSTFSWTQQWYPLAVVADLDPSRPHAMMLLGKELVLWRDNQQQWRCFEDMCPHRKVPLSEGRIEPSDGSLMCGYHGWRFDGSGKAVSIPTVAKVHPQAEAQACASCKAAANAYPAQVRQGLLWVWAESGSQAVEDSKQREPAINPLYERVPEDKWTYGFAQYVRDLPGGFDCWIENMTDQSHVAFAHHGVAGNRDGEHTGYLKMLHITNQPEPQDGIQFDFEWSGGQRAPAKTTFTFTPPAYCEFAVATGRFQLWIYAVPVSADCTRLIINAGGNFGDKLPAMARFLSKVRPRWMGHLTLNAVNDGDIVFMHKQSSHNRLVASQHDGRIDWAKHYHTPSEADGGPMLFRRWLDTKGGGGPQYEGALQTGLGIPNVGVAQKMQPHQRRLLLDRLGQHTQQCASCTKALQQVQMAIKASGGVAAAAVPALAAVLARGVAPLSPVPIVLTLAAVVAAVCCVQLRKLERSFVFTDWHNCEQ